MKKMEAVVNNCNEEIGWYGFIIELPNNEFHLEDIFVPKFQTLSGGSCTILSEGDNEALEWEMKKQDELKTGFIRLWGHSHVNMGTGPSPQDETQFESLSKDIPYYIRLIMNKKKEINITFAAYGFKINVPTYYIDQSNEYEEWAASIVDAASKHSKSLIPKHDPYDYRNNYYNGYDGYGKKKSDDQLGLKDNSLTTNTLIQPNLPFGEKNQKPVTDIAGNTTNKTRLLSPVLDKLDQQTVALLWEILVVLDGYNLRVGKYDKDDFANVCTLSEYYLKSSIQVQHEIDMFLSERGYII